MKKLVFPIVVFFFFFKPALAFGQNKAGINIGDHLNELDKAASIVGKGGWIVVMACPGDADEIAQNISKHPEINLIIRGHYPGFIPDATLAKLWAASLSSLLTPNKIYFMPWNEPNQSGSDDYASQTQLAEYINDLIKELSPIRNRVFLLSPMMNITNPNYDAYVAGLPTGFFNQFDGIAFSLYDTCNGDCTDPHQNPLYSSQLLSNIGASDKKIFGVESGTAGDFFYFKQPPNVNSPLYKYVNGILNNQPSFIEMIGIPSYDLAGEVGHSWSLFEPSDVINLLKNFPDGTNLPASVTVPVTLSKCPGKNYSFYIRDPSQCSECGSELGEIIYPQNSTFCTKEVNFKYQQDLPSSSAPIYSSEDEGITGEFFVDKVELPDFSTMEQNMTKALKKLLPQELNEQMDIQNKILSSEAKHFVTGKTAEEKSTSSTKKAKTKITTDLWWSNLLGQTKILCGLFGTCTAPKSMVIQIEDATQSVKDDADQIACTTIGSETGEKKEETITHEKEFQTTSFFKKLWDALTGKNEESSDFFGTTRGQIAGGASFQSFSDFQRIFIPQEMMDEWEIKTGASIDKTDFSLTVKGKEKTENASVYYTEMEKEKFKRCITLCSIYPAGFDISAIDPMCTSCNPNDYKIDYIDVDKTNCHPIGGEGCDYYSEDTTPRCNGDPICESGKCYHNMYRMNNDYTDRGCPLPYNASGCTLREICVPMTFKKNPNGGFGPCQYTNSNVCVRSDWKDSGTGMCDYLCNWACCAYQ